MGCASKLLAKIAGCVQLLDSLDFRELYKLSVRVFLLTFFAVAGFVESILQLISKGEEEHEIESSSNHSRIRTKIIAAARLRMLAKQKRKDNIVELAFGSLDADDQALHQFAEAEGEVGGEVEGEAEAAPSRSSSSKKVLEKINSRKHSLSLFANA